MDLEPPINVLKLVADLSYVALADISKLATDTSMGSGYRLQTPEFISINPGGRTSGDDVYAYRVVNVADGEYQLRVLVDLNDNEELDSGDLDGYNGGSVDAPIVEHELAPVITIAGASVQEENFGLGPIE